jgi:hypothetical protein
MRTANSSVKYELSSSALGQPDDPPVHNLHVEEKTTVKCLKPVQTMYITQACGRDMQSYRMTWLEGA